VLLFCRDFQIGVSLFVPYIILIPITGHCQADIDKHAYLGHHDFMKDEERKYSDEETKAIIQRALELQHTQASEIKSTDGVSLSDLTAIGKELGIDPAVIRHAVSDISSRSNNRKNLRLLGAPVRPEERVFLRGSLPEEELRELSAGISGITGEAGQGSAAGSHLSWNSSGYYAMRTGTQLQIEISSYPEEGTVVLIKADCSSAAGGIFGGLGGGIGLGAGLGVGLGVGIGALGSPLFAALVPLGFLGFAFILSRSIFKAIVRGQQKKIKDISVKLQAFLSRKLNKNG
jgi:hypothetical protein